MVAAALSLVVSKQLLTALRAPPNLQKFAHTVGSALPLSASPSHHGPSHTKIITLAPQSQASVDG